MSLWLGSLVILLVVAPAAFRALHPSDRAPLRARVLGRFSRMAMPAVTLLLVTGAAQSIALVGSFAALVDTAYGRLVLAKILLLAALITVGAYNQRRLLPRLMVVCTGDEEPGRAATVLRRSVTLEVGIAVIVLSMTSVLVTTEPATSS